MEPVCGRKTMIRWKFYSHHDVGKTRRYWGGQNVRLDFSIRCYRKIYMNFFGQLSIWGGHCKSPGERRNETLNQDSGSRGESQGQR